MTRNVLRGSSAVGIGVMLLVGIARTQSRLEEREAAVKKLCEDERARAGVGATSGGSGAGGSGGGIGGAVGGLAGRLGRLPDAAPPPPGPGTPEIALSAEAAGAAAGAGAAAAGAGGAAALAQATPGSTLDLTIGGRFAVGTHFLFDSDALQVTKESVSANTYVVSARVLPSAGPAVVQLQAFAPMTCAQSLPVPVALVGGKYAWELRGGDGSRLLLKSEGAGLARTADGKFEDTYVAEFYRPSEAKPYQVRKAVVGPAGQGVYTLVTGGQSAISPMESVQAEMQKLMTRISDPSLSDAEKEKVSKQYGDLLDKLQVATDDMVERAQTDCSGSLTWNGTLAQTTLDCPQRMALGGSARLELKGTMKSLGR